MRYLCPILCSIVASLSLASVQGPALEPREMLPTDRTQRRVENITQPRQEYLIPFRSQVDGAMTRMPISYAAYKQGFQPNLWVRMENVGESDVVNPWLTANGLGDWRTVKKIADEATRGCTTDAEKARAIWEWERSHRFHACTWDKECDDAVKVHNVYGYTLCGDDAIILTHILKAAGLTPRRGYPVGHCVTEAFYDGEFHLLDGDEHVICLRRDNKTIASEAEVVRDHDLMKRTHTYGIGGADSPLTDQFSASLYGYEGERKGELGGESTHTMFFTLRPGEGLQWRFDHIGKEYSYGTDQDPNKPWQDGNGQLRTWGGLAYENLRNGKWTYRPPLDSNVWRKGAAVLENVAATDAAPAEAGKPLKLVWKVASPYVLVGADLKCRYTLASDSDLFRLSLSPDGKAWQAVAEGGKAGRNYVAPRVDQYLSPRGKPMYEYFVQVELQGDPAKARLDDIEFDSDVQMSLLGMPELVVGNNKLLYTDETKGQRQVRITHAWIERSGCHPPTAPAAAVSPADGATVEGTNLTLKWAEARDPDADKIADYHIQLCERPDLRWVLSPNFDKLISHTPSKGKAEWAIPFTGLLNPGTTYYWRVRAMDDKGVWGPWSHRFSFQCTAPGVPLNLQTAQLPDGTITVTWQANPEGRQPVAYKVYGSNEQGFTASDVEYIVAAGRGFCDTMEEYNAKTTKGDDPFHGNVKTPPNVVAKTDQTTMVVAGPGVPNERNLNKAFYRVVAIDAMGNDSGPSDFVALPRPFVYTRPVTDAVAGQQYRYEPQAIHSIGHYTCNGSYNAAYWQREKLTWSLEQAPAWLTLEKSVLQGTPVAGQHQVVLKVANNKGQEAKQSYTINCK